MVGLKYVFETAMKYLSVFLFYLSFFIWKNKAPTLQIICVASLLRSGFSFWARVGWDSPDGRGGRLTRELILVL